jgi:flagellar protein FliS
VTPYAASPAAYKQQSILTAPPERLVVMLYDGARRFFFQAATAMRDGDQRQADERLRRGEAIVDELLVTLDLERGGQIATNLQAIYLFCKRQLMEARMERDPGRVEWVSAQLGELREAWAQVGSAASAA